MQVLDCVVIACERLRSHPLCPALTERFKGLKFNAKSPVDILFPSLKPSMAILIVEDGRIAEVSRIADAQRKFKNSFAILVGIDDTTWMDVQLEVPLGNLRMLRALHPSDVIEMIMTLYEEMSDNIRLDQQSEYFRNLHQQLGSRIAAREFVYKVMNKLGIPPESTTLIIEAFPSIRRLVSATEEDLLENCPIDVEYIQRIIQFFNAPSSTLEEADSI